MKTFNGRVVAPGEICAEAVVSHGGLNTLASFQKALQFGDKTATCGDQNNPDLYGKQMAGKALCLPKTIGSTTGGLVLYCACAMGRQPACMLFSEAIDSLAGAGVILADIWLDNIKMPVIDSLGDEFLDYVKDGMKISIKENGAETLKSAKTKALLIYSANDTMCTRLHYDTLKAELSDCENARLLLLENKGHNPNYTEDAVQYLGEYLKAKKRRKKQKSLASEAQREAFVSSFDWNRMTAQDAAVWDEILRFLK